MRIGVTKERRDVDQNSVQQRAEFLRISFEYRVVGSEAVRTNLLHAQRDASAQAGPLVAAEVDAAALLDVADQCVERNVIRFVWQVWNTFRVYRIDHRTPCSSRSCRQRGVSTSSPIAARKAGYASHHSTT
jgi:hypothetical protein